MGLLNGQLNRSHPPGSKGDARSSGSMSLIRRRGCGAHPNQRSLRVCVGVLGMSMRRSLWTGQTSTSPRHGRPARLHGCAFDDSLVSRCVTVQGTYALDDDAHLLVGREGTAWHSLCGRKDQNDEVVWAGHEWPEAYDECPECAAMVDSSLWAEDARQETTEAGRAHPRSYEKRVQEYRLMGCRIRSGSRHRPSDQSLSKAMCGADLRPKVVQRTTPMGGPLHCHSCDRAVGGRGQQDDRRVRWSSRSDPRCGPPERLGNERSCQTSERGEFPLAPIRRSSCMGEE